MNHRVLIVGFRPGISDALSRLGIEHGVWHNKPLKSRRQFVISLTKDFPRSRNAIHAIGEELAGAGPFTHVIAGTEAAVYPASVLRRCLLARKSKNSIALRCHDKLVMKEYLCEHDIPMVEFMAGDANVEASKIMQVLGSPVVVKPRQLSGGRNLIFAESAEVLRRENNRNKILERYIDAPEYSVESFSNKGKILMQSITQYYVKGHVNIVPAIVPDELKQRLYDFNRRVINAMNINWGITHLEVYVKDRDIFFGEIALRPPGGYLMELISASYGINAWDAQVAMELDKEFTFPKQQHAYSAACIFHPGKGVLNSVENWERATLLPGVFQAKLKRELGESLMQRDSVGEDIGYLLLKEENSNKLLEQVDWIQQNIRFNLEAGAPKT